MLTWRDKEPGWGLEDAVLRGRNGEGGGEVPSQGSPKGSVLNSFQLFRDRTNQHFARTVRRSYSHGLVMTKPVSYSQWSTAMKYTFLSTCIT